jgi:hypothetical protein
MGEAKNTNDKLKKIANRSSSCKPCFPKRKGAKIPSFVQQFVAFPDDLVFFCTVINK